MLLIFALLMSNLCHICYTLRITSNDGINDLTPVLSHSLDSKDDDAHSQDGNMSSHLQESLAECRLENQGAPTAHGIRLLPYAHVDPRVRCSLQSVDAHTARALEPHVIIYPNAHMGNVNAGVDLIPETRDELSVFSRAGQLNQEGKLNEHVFEINRAQGKLQLQTCDEGNKTGGYVALRLGPVVTVGSEAWVEFGINDIGVRSILKDHKDGFWISDLSAVPIDEKGDPLGYPPLHLHHMHWIPGRTLFRRNSAKCFIFGDNSHCYAETAGSEIHGDYECKKEDGGTHCMNRALPTGTGRLIKENWGLQSHIIDARPTGSAPLKWYFQNSFVWKAKETTILRPLSTFELSPVLSYSGGLTDIGSLHVRTDSASFHWWTDVFRRKGELVHFILHTHSKAFQEVIVFEGTPRDVGLDGNYFRWIKASGEQAFKTQRPQDYGFTSNAQVRLYVLENLAQTMKREKLVQHKANEILYQPSLKCQGNTSVEDVQIGEETFVFDRRPKVCCKPWAFESGTPWTAVAFFQYNETSRAWSAPDIVPSFFPMHVGFFFHYIGGETSTYDTEHGTQTYPPPNVNLQQYDLFNSAFGQSLNAVHQMTSLPERIPFFLAKYYQWQVAFQWTIHVVGIYGAMYWPITLLLVLLVIMSSASCFVQGTILKKD